MNTQTSHTSSGSTNKTSRLKTPIFVLTSVALVLALSACGKHDDNQTAGQKLDSAIAKTGQAAEEAKLKTEQSASEVKAKTEETFANAGAALKDATQNAQASAKEVAGKAVEKMDDMAISTAVSAELGKDPDLSVFKIDVDTKDGAVTLNGSAPNEAARERAGAIAKKFSGVLSVNNKLIVKPA